MFLSVQAGNCLIYSFGIENDWSFEDTMGELGCKVRAFDPTIDAPAQRSENVSFHKIGISYQTETTIIAEVMSDVMTLDDIREKFGEEDATISYLKVPNLGMQREVSKLTLKTLFHSWTWKALKFQLCQLGSKTKA